MQTKRLPGYPGYYWRKLARPLLIAAVFFGLGYLFCFGITSQPCLQPLGIAAFILCGCSVIYVVLYSAYKLLPGSICCPSCGKRLDRSHKWKAETTCYVCQNCQIRWDSGVRISD